MQVGDLVKTTKGNLCLITRIGIGQPNTGAVLHCDVLFTATGVHRTGFPLHKLSKIKNGQKMTETKLDKILK